jgi:hypothetical protein
MTYFAMNSTTLDAVVVVARMDAVLQTEGAQVTHARVLKLFIMGYESLPPYTLCVGIDDLRSTIEPPGRWRYKRTTPNSFLVRVEFLVLEDHLDTG